MSSGAAQPESCPACGARWAAGARRCGLCGRPAGPSRRAMLLAALVGVGLAVLHQGTFFFPLLGETGASLGAMEEVHTLIAERWVETPDPTRLRDAALEGMVGTLDPFSDYVPPAGLQAFEEHTTGQFGGVGIYLEVRDERLVVITPLEDTPAWKAGIQPGDVVLRIDGREARFAQTSDAVDVLKGPVGSVVEVTVRHVNGQEETVRLERAVIQVRTAKCERVLSDGIGYLRLTSFNAGTVAELDQCLDRLVAEGARALILDLRLNPGGYLRGAVEVADRFLPAGKVVVTTRSRGGVLEQQLETELPAKVSGWPLAVLIDGGTASAAEILAGALQDQGVATTVGARSYGKGSVQSLLDIMGGKAQLKLTTQYFFTPQGRRIHRGELPAEDDSWGIAPDIEVGLAPERARELAIRESELDIARITARREGRPWEGEDRLHLDDPQVAAAFVHLQRVLAGQEALGVRRQLSPASTAPLDSRDTAAIPPTEQEQEEEEAPR